MVATPSSVDERAWEERSRLIARSSHHLEHPMVLCLSAARRIAQIEQAARKGLGAERFPSRGDHGLVVSESLRRTASTPEVLVLHRGRLAEGDIERRQGFAVTRPIRTVTDIVVLGHQEFAEQALRDGARRGVITHRQILELRRVGGHPEWFDRMLEQYGA